MHESGAMGVSRRQFLAATAAGGLLIGVPWPSSATKQTRAAAARLGFFVAIEPDGRVLIGVPNPDMGQGVRTALPMLVAEELDVPWQSVRVVQMPLAIKENGEGGHTWVHGPQGAGGSMSVAGNWVPLREAGARARQMLILAAAAAWDVPAESLSTEPGQVVHAGSDRRMPYAELAAAAALLELPEQAPELKERAAYRIIGRPVPVVDCEEIVTGRSVYGIDVVLPGMKYACIARSPWFDGRPLRVDDKAARAVPGVRDVFTIDGPEPGAPYTTLASGVAVVADNTWAALKGREALKVEWDRGPHVDESTASLRTACSEALKLPGQIVRDDGEFDAGLANAAQVVERRYELPYVAHCTLEPQVCVADIRANSATIIGPIQMPAGASRMVNQLTGLDRLAIDVQVTRLGGGFGRRLTVDYVAEATLVSQKIGAPVKLQWTREDDLHHDYYRPGGMHELRAGLDADGRIVAWTQRLASPSKYYRRPNVSREEMYRSELFGDDFPAGLVPAYRLEYHPVDSGAPRGSWRAPGHTANAFAVQSFLDELAHASGRDPLAMRLEMLGEPRDLAYDGHGGPIFSTGRLAGVLHTVAARSGWGAKLAPGRGRGIAAHFTFGGYVAYVVDVTVREGRLTVDRVIGAIDCGLAVNPLGVEAQMEGGIHDALSTALGLQITIEGGRVQQNNFDSYPLLRLAQAPKQVEVHIVDSGYPPSGVGEPPVPPLAPALTNAIFAATGKRIRRLPVGDQLA